MVVEVQAIYPRGGRGTRVRHLGLVELLEPIPVADRKREVALLPIVAAARGLQRDHAPAVRLERRPIEVPAQEREHPMGGLDGRGQATPEVRSEAWECRAILHRIGVDPDLVQLGDSPAGVKIRDYDVQRPCSASQREDRGPPKPNQGPPRHLGRSPSPKP